MVKDTREACHTRCAQSALASFLMLIAAVLMTPFSLLIGNNSTNGDKVVEDARNVEAFDEVAEAKDPATSPVDEPSPVGRSAL